MSKSKSGKEKKYHPLLPPPTTGPPLTLEQRVANALDVDYGSSTTSTSINIGDLTQNIPDNKPINITSTGNAANITPRKTATVITPSEKRKVTVAYKEEKQKMEDKPNVEQSEKKIPQFDVTLGRSSRKIKVLGISV